MGEVDSLKDMGERLKKELENQSMETQSSQAATDLSTVETDKMKAIIEAEWLMEEFECLLSTITKSLEGVDLQNLKLRIHWYLALQRANTSEVQEHLDRLESVETPQGVLFFLINRNFIGYLNYELIKEFHKVMKRKDVEAAIEAYERNHFDFLRHFSLSAITEAFKECPKLAPVSSIGLPKFTIRLETPWEGRSAYEWRELLEMKFDWPSNLIIVSIEKNCIVLIYAVLPFFVSSVTRDLLDNDVLTELEKQGVSVELSTELLKLGNDENQFISSKLKTSNKKKKNDSPSDQNESKPLSSQKITRDDSLRLPVSSSVNNSIVPECQPQPEPVTGGYDDTMFISSPPESLRCPVCLLVVREPHQLSCCGVLLCQVCIERIQANQQTCPCCRSDKFNKMLDKRTRGTELYGLNVRCENHHCDWKGELGELHRHLSNNCRYVVEKCSYECGKYFHRFSLPVHEQDECIKRPIEVKIASYQKTLMEKFSALELKCQVEVESLKKNLKIQEERQEIEKIELQKSYERYKNEMQKKQEELCNSFKRQEEKHQADKKELVHNLQKQKEQYELEMRELHEKYEKDKQIVNLQMVAYREEIKTLRKKSETDKVELLEHVNEKEEKHETSERELALELQKQTKWEKKEIESLQRKVVNDKKEIMKFIEEQETKLEAHKKEIQLHVKKQRDMQEKKCEANKSQILNYAQELQNRQDEHEKQQKVLEDKICKYKTEFQEHMQDRQKKLEEELITARHQIQEQNENFRKELEKVEKERKALQQKLAKQEKKQDELQQHLENKQEVYQAQFTTLRKQEVVEVSKLKREQEKERNQIKVTKLKNQQSGLIRPRWYHPLVTKSPPSNAPFIINMTNFCKKKNFGDTWYSPPFYTGTNGYRLQLGVYANGDGNGKGTHVSLFVYLMEGVNDDILTWPFKGEITVQLLNWSENRQHQRKIISFNDNDDNKYRSRVFMGERAANGLGYNQFIRHADLDYNQCKDTQYLQDDTLCFEISCINLLTGPEVPRWCVTPVTKSPRLLPPCTLSMLNFSEHKRVGDQWCSPPVYTGPSGYKLQLQVDAEGDGTGSNTHVSVYVRLMKGENDDILTWPFRCDVTIQILNWWEDKGHMEKTIQFNNSVDIKYCKAVMERERAPALGFGQFISHSDLISDSTQYICNDALCFLVSKVILH